MAAASGAPAPKKALSPASATRRDKWEAKFGSKTKFEDKEKEYRKCIAAWLDQNDPKNDAKYNSIVRNFVHGRIGYEIFTPGIPLTLSGSNLSKFPDGHKERNKAKFVKHRNDFLAAAEIVLKKDKNDLRDIVWSLPENEKCPKRKALKPKEPEAVKPKVPAAAVSGSPKPKPKGPAAASGSPKANKTSPKAKAAANGSPKAQAQAPQPKFNKPAAAVPDIIDLSFDFGERPGYAKDAEKKAEAARRAYEKEAEKRMISDAIAASKAEDAKRAAEKEAEKTAIIAAQAASKAAAIAESAAAQKAAADANAAALRAKEAALDAAKAIGSRIATGTTPKRRPSQFDVKAPAAAESGSRADQKGPSGNGQAIPSAALAAAESAATLDNKYRVMPQNLIFYQPTKPADLIPPSKRDDTFKADARTLTSLIKNENQTFVKAVHRNVTELMKWQLEQYNDLIDKKAGSESKKEEFEKRAAAEEKKEKKKKNQEEEGDGGGDASEDYIIALIQKRNLVDSIIPLNKAGTRKLTWTLKEMQERLLDAIENKKRGIMTIDGDARKPIRDQLLRTIYSLSINIARFKLGENLVLTGPAGSGKTTVAGVIGFVYSRIGIMPTDYFADVPVTGIVSSYVNRTAEETQRKVSAALGGTIFFDEFYRLSPECSAPDRGRRARRFEAIEGAVDTAQERPRIRRANSARAGGASSDHGIEAINQLVAMLNEIRGLIVIIIAGYSRNMDCVLGANEGLERRFIKKIDLVPFTIDDLTNLLQKRAMSALADQKKESGEHFKIRADATRYIQTVFTKLQELNALQNQAGDVDLIGAYFATALGESELDGLNWNRRDRDDDLIILSRAFNQFAEKKKLSVRFRAPGGRRAGGGDSAFLAPRAEIPLVEVPFLRARFTPRIKLLL